MGPDTDAVGCGVLLVRSEPDLYRSVCSLPCLRPALPCRRREKCPGLLVICPLGSLGRKILPVRRNNAEGMARRRLHHDMPADPGLHPRP